jgi:hypothetical protein
MSGPADAFEISTPLRTADAGFIALDIRLRRQDAPTAGQQASTIAHKRSASVTFEPAAKEQRDLLGNWAYQAFSSAWTTRPAASIQIDYTAARSTTMDGSAGQSSWHLGYIIAVLHGLFAMPEQKLPAGARLWAIGEVRTESFVEVGQHELLDKARIIGGMTGPGGRQYLIVYQGDAAWAAQRAFLDALSQMGRLPEALESVKLLRFRDRETLRSLLDLDSFEAWDNDVCERKGGPLPRAPLAAPAPAPIAAPVAPAPAPIAAPVAPAPAPIAAPVAPAPAPFADPGIAAPPAPLQAGPDTPAGRPSGKSWLPIAALGALGAVTVAAVAGVLLTRRPDPPPAPPAPAKTAQGAPAAAVPDAGQDAAIEPPPPEPEGPRDAGPPKLWGRLPKADPPPPKPEAPPPKPAAQKDAGPEPPEAVRVIQAKTNLGTSLDTAEHRRVPSTAE